MQTPEEREEEETAKFHYAEGNKFGLEFAKSLFLFNSALVVALIAYMAKENLPPRTTLWIGKAIVAFWLAWAVSIGVFAFGYLVNLNQGNSHRAPDAKAKDEAWHRAQRFSGAIYTAAIVVGLLVTTGFCCLLKAGGAF